MQPNAAPRLRLCLASILRQCLELNPNLGLCQRIHLHLFVTSHRNERYLYLSWLLGCGSVRSDSWTWPPSTQRKEREAPRCRSRTSVAGRPHPGPNSAQCCRLSRIAGKWHNSFWCWEMFLWIFWIDVSADDDPTLHRIARASTPLEAWWCHDLGLGALPHNSQNNFTSFAFDHWSHCPSPSVPASCRWTIKSQRHLCCFTVRCHGAWVSTAQFQLPYLPLVSHFPSLSIIFNCFLFFFLNLRSWLHNFSQVLAQQLASRHQDLGLAAVSTGGNLCVDLRPLPCAHASAMWFEPWHKRDATNTNFRREHL